MSYRLPLITVNGFKDGCVEYSWFDWPLIDMKKSLKKPNEQLEAVNRRRTDNTMTKSETTKHKQWSTKLYTES